jgi:hypothetical protein
VPIAAPAKAFALKHFVERWPFLLAGPFVDGLYKVVIERASECVQPSPIII